ncbi:hypothetical protein KUCAC02_010589 [Chaenocephalus aceratus]|uniref:Uncharacterized protein n=1 Tax=Chaenocephalus aceratus TaxID=36190 RepID=A0ACB9W0N7_CHAAC|nr:hypothetical protein KUCAC02_010589 [Chaenocephalus aceratus]
MRHLRVTLSCLVACVSVRALQLGGRGGGSELSPGNRARPAALRAPDQAERDPTSRTPSRRLRCDGSEEAARREEVREDGRVEIPSFDGQAAYNNEVQAENSEIISFAESAWSWLGSLDPVCLLASWLTPPRSDAASRGTAQRKGLQKTLQPGELVPPKHKGACIVVVTGGLGGEHRVNCLLVSQAASYLWWRQHRGERSAKRPRAGEGDDANRLSLLTWSRGSSLRDLVSRIHGSGAGSTVRSGAEDERERGRWRSSDRHFLIAHYCRSDPVNSRAPSEASCDEAAWLQLIVAAVVLS